MPSKSQARISKKAPLDVFDAPTGPMPVSAKILLALAIPGAFAYTMRLWVTPIKSWDLWFHMKAGEWIITHGRIPPGDIFSAAFRGSDWIVNAWLSDVFFRIVHATGGSVGILLVQVILSLLVFTLMGFACYRLSGRPTLSATCAFLALVATYFRFNARPELFTLVFMVAMLAILYEYKFSPTDRIIWLVPMGALWPNLHMGFTVAPVILGCVLLADGAVAWYLNMNRKPVPGVVIQGPRLKRLAWISLAMTAATLINPYGPKAWFFVSRLTGQFTRIAEWQPLMQVAKSIEFVPMGAMLFLAIIALGALVLSRRPQDFAGFLLAVVFAAAMLKFSRQMAQFCLVAPFVACAAVRDLHFPEPLRRLAVRFTHPVRATSGAAGLVILVTAAVLVMVFMRVPKEVTGSPFGFGLDKTKFSEGAARFVKENGLAGSLLYNSLESGSWIIWRLGPSQPVYIDGRLDMYGFDALNRYVGIATSRDCGSLLRDQKVNYCYFRFPEGKESITSPYHAKSLASDPHWALVYYDDGGIIYVRRNQRNAQIIQKHEYTILNPLMLSDLQFADLGGSEKQVIKEAKHSLRASPHSARAHLTAGVALHQIGRHDESIQRLEMARKNATRWGSGLMGSLEDYEARVMIAKEDYASAIKHFQKATKYAWTGEKRNEREAGLRNNMAYAYLKLKKYAEAEKQLKLALDLQEDGISWVNLGRVRIAQHRYKEAVECFDKALQMADNLLIARILMAQSFALMGKSEDALQNLEIAAQENPGMVAEASADPEFDSLRSNPRFLALTGH